MNSFHASIVVVVSVVILVIIGYFTLSPVDNGIVINVPTSNVQSSIIPIPLADRLGLKVVCLNGIEYWMDDSRQSNRSSIAPKYSPGVVGPDTCTE